MSDVMSWSLRMSVKEGEGEKLGPLMEEMAAATAADEPGTLTYEWFTSDDGSTVHVNERYSDSDALMVHVGNFGEKFADRFFAIFDVTGFDVYGNPSDAVREALGGMGANFLGTLGGFAR